MQACGHFQKNIINSSVMQLMTVELSAFIAGCGDFIAVEKVGAFSLLILIEFKEVIAYFVHFRNSAKDC